MLLRIIADMLHLASILILLRKIRNTRNCIGVSAKTQELYLLVFCLRYIDLFMYYISLYNILMKIAFIASTAYTVYLVKYKKPFCNTYEKEKDDFGHINYLLPLAGVLALFIHTSFRPFEIIWSYSIWLEALAIMPQLSLLRKLGEVENITSHYVAALGLYRLFYILNWIYQYLMYNRICWTSLLAGLVQTMLYADFFYYYIISIRKGKSTVALPL